VAIYPVPRAPRPPVRVPTVLSYLSTPVVDSPDDIAGLTIWLEADAIGGLADGDPITTWEDSSAANNDGTQIDGAAKPAYQTNELNGLPIVRFDGSNDFFNLPDLSALTAGTAFVVVKLDADPPGSVGQSGLWHLGTDAVNATYFIYPPDSNLYDAFGSTSRPAGVDPTPSMAEWRIYEAVSATNDWRNYIDGTLLGTDGTNTVGFPAAPLLGSGLANVNYLDGDMAEFILFDSALSDSNRDAVRNYLIAKWFTAAPASAVKQLALLGVG
jgi:hypothetical protein